MNDKKYTKVSRIVDFYCFDGKNATHDFNSIMKFDFEQLEHNHRYIQWLFPLCKHSGYNLMAPTLTNKDISILRSNKFAMKRLEQAFVKMLDFYGYSYDGKMVMKNPNFHNRSVCWINGNNSTNHNYLRITRILKSLCLLGRRDLSRAFYNALLELNKDYVIPEKTWIFWERTQ